jgi:hypothetical protein
MELLTLSCRTRRAIPLHNIVFPNGSVAAVHVSFVPYLKRTIVTLTTVGNDVIFCDFDHVEIDWFSYDDGFMGYRSTSSECGDYNISFAARSMSETNKCPRYFFEIELTARNIYYRSVIEVSANQFATVATDSGRCSETARRGNWVSHMQMLIDLQLRR